MNGSLVESRKLVDALRAGVGSSGQPTCCSAPPYVYLRAVRQWLAGSSFAARRPGCRGPQGSGAYTGEVSGAMLADLGCWHVIVGHSERRALYGETDAIVATKFKRAQAAGLIPILCVGETLAQRDAGETEQTCRRQLTAVLDPAGVDSVREAVVAYEPVWAIGTGRTATSRAGARSARVHPRA